MFCFALLQTKTQAYLAWLAYRNWWQFYNGCWFLKNNNIISLLLNQLRYSIKKTAYFALILSLLNLKCLEKYIHVNFCKERFDMICLTLSQIRSNKFWTRKKKDKKKKYQSISSVCIEILWVVIIQTVCKVVVVYIDFLLDNWKIISIWQ